MKKLFFLVMLGLVSTMAMPAKAQVNISINIGSQPHWGPSGYNHVDYYYLPDIESYYYVPSKQFIYFSGNRWIHSRSLPHQYRGYNLYSGRKYVINSPKPYLHHQVYKVKYKSNPRRDNNRKYNVHSPVNHGHSNNKHYKPQRNSRSSYGKRDPGIERIIRPRG